MSENEDGDEDGELGHALEWVAVDLGNCVNSQATQSDSDIAIPSDAG